MYFAFGKPSNVLVEIVANTFLEGTMIALQFCILKSKNNFCEDLFKWNWFHIMF